MNKYFLIAFFIVLRSPFSYAQGNFPENGPLYIDTLVPRIDITINPDTLAWIYANVESDQEFHARFVFDNGSVRDTLDSIGFRLRGNTSRYSQKKSFKVSFNTFIDGRKYYGVEKLNLNGEHNDPSIMRSKMMWDIMRSWGIPAPRANHVQVYINSNYYGLYLSVEHIDEEFVLNRFENNDGNLYKCTYPVDLTYLGDDPNSYKFLSGDERAYELTINEEDDDYSDLAHFINVLNNTPNEDLICKLDSNFNTYDYLKMMAADIFCGNWDGYIFNKNNFYLYHNTATGKMEYIPYDVDNTFGIDWFNIDWAKRNIYTWQMDGAPRPLYSRLINNPELRKQFSYYANKLIVNTLNIEAIKESVTIRKNLIAPYVQTDPYYPRDYGFTYTDFLNSFTQAFGAHVKYGLFPFLDARKASMLVQVEQFAMVPVIKYIRHKREVGQKILINAKVDVQVMPAQVFVLYSKNDGETIQTEMIPSTDGNYYITLDGISSFDKLSYQIHVRDGIQQEKVMPCQSVVVSPSSGDTPLLFINEFMADNLSTISDEFGIFSDWVEVYNGDEEDVFLGNFFLTDNLDVPNKWQMPEVILPSGEFALFWADGSPTLGDYHADFKLGKSGEAIGIFSSDFLTVDTLHFGAQTTDISFGRLPNGSSAWELFPTPTPGASNVANTIGINEVIRKQDFFLYPNPVSGNRIHFNKEIDCQIFNSLGEKVFEGRKKKEIAIDKFANGLYFVISENKIVGKFIVNKS